MPNLAHIDSNNALILTMQDDLGIVYLIESAQQFWSELEDVLRLSEEVPTLSLLDATLRRFMALCSTYHEQYLQSPLQLEHACNYLLESELFEFHSERMLELIIDDVQMITDPHSAYISYEVLFYYGRHKADFFRSHKRWQPLLPLLMDHILVEIDPDIEDTYVGTAVGKGANFSSVPIPIEAKLRSLCVKLLYEVCKVQTLSVQDLKIFDDSFLDYLFDLVEQTKYMHDDTFNYSVIKLIIAMNEQFMVAGLGEEEVHAHLGKKESSDPKNRVIRVMMRRLGLCKTFGENMIFMLNRTKHTPEDFCVKLLILKILYVLFSTKGTSEFFYTNDLCVLVDVFLRELADLDEENESLRHTYLRVLHPLLTKTQLREVPYKRPQILVALESMTAKSRIREINPTTKRLVERCLSGDWCIPLRELRMSSGDSEHRVGSPNSEGSAILSPPGHPGPMSMAASQRLEVSSSSRVMMSMKYSKSVENLSGRLDSPRQPLRSPLDQARRPSNASVHSLPGAVASSSKVPLAPAPKKRSTSKAAESHHPSRHSSLDSDFLEYSQTKLVISVGERVNTINTNPPHPSASRQHSPTVPITSVPLANVEDSPQRRRRPPPPAPPKRRKPPAIPIGTTNSGATITSIRSSEPSPLAKVHKPQIGLQQAS
ncbi:hypothetical protein GALMADRAFT_225296 [Galerina marginata CBS 339.88]|uniref:SPIN90/Ldb17 leucine-rich domain-containing protein n=1 Tax=Galerina marginata (strain CBS 339.88) TaxID=685588 RepID=A0A067TDU5_GALM3|nr:hypothetical protein GALMADRAFT_225296 [Galerina marginata CBS 339.88]